MDQYVTGGAIRALREKRKLTQFQLAEKLMVSDKTVSKWETGAFPQLRILLQQPKPTLTKHFAETRI